MANSEGETPPSTKFLILLSPPRSFSSVVSTMIGQHPELYGFPELHLFIGDTLQEVLDREQAAGNAFGPPGMLRAIAQLNDGVQTSATITRAIGWLGQRRHWSTKWMMEYLRARVAPLIGMEKSPITALKPLWLERAHAFYPDAYYLHLTRHPVSTRRSMDVFLARGRESQEHARPFDNLLSWYRFHRNILEFTSTLPPGQSMRVKGEDVLSKPDLYLAQIAEWLGVSLDPSAIEAMKHPERSPYAYRGPPPASGGNDGNFMRNPVLRPGRVNEPSLKTYFDSEPMTWVSAADAALLADIGYRLASPRILKEEVAGLAQALGYQ